MPNLSIKDVPEAWAQALRERAARNHRSLQGELMALLEVAVAPESSTSTSPFTSTSQVSNHIVQALAAGVTGASGQKGIAVGVDRFGHPVVRQGWKTVESVVAELKAKYPLGPVPGQSSSIAMIREDRDSR